MTAHPFLFLCLLFGVLPQAQAGSLHKQTVQSVQTQLPGLHLSIPGQDWGVYQPRSVTVLQDLAAGGVYFENTKNPTIHGMIHQRLRKSTGANPGLSLKNYCTGLKKDAGKSGPFKFTYVDSKPQGYCMSQTDASQQYFTAKAFSYSKQYFYLNIFTFLNDPAPGRTLANQQTAQPNKAFSKVSMVRGAQ